MGPVVAIHQPNFFPWLGYFDKIRRADIFVFMDNVQFPRTSRGTWVNRVKVLIGGEPRWLTCPVSRQGEQNICDTLIADQVDWRSRQWNCLQHNYGKAAFWRRESPWLYDLFVNRESRLGLYNMDVIRELAARLDLSTEFVLGSELGPFQESATDLLIAITRCVGGGAYLCGGGAADYQEDRLFEAHNIELIYQKFSHPQYSQLGARVFVPGLSVLDSLLNVGLTECSRMLRES